MPLKEDAIELGQILQKVVSALIAFRHPYGSSYGADMASHIAPLVTDYRAAITTHRSRQLAQQALDDLHPLVSNVAGASTKGDLAIFRYPDHDVLDRYYTLYTIFRESRYENDIL